MISTEWKDQCAKCEGDAVSVRHINKSHVDTLAQVLASVDKEKIHTGAQVLALVDKEKIIFRNKHNAADWPEEIF